MDVMRTNAKTYAFNHYREKDVETNDFEHYPNIKIRYVRIISNQASQFQNKFKL